MKEQIGYGIDETKLMLKLKRCKRRLKEQRHYSEYLKCKLAKKALQNQELKEKIRGVNAKCTRELNDVCAAKDAEIAKLNGWVDELIHLGEGAIIGYGTSPWNTLVTRINQERAHE